MRKRPIRKTARSGPDDRLRLIAYEIHDGLCQQLAAGISYLTSYAETRSDSSGESDEWFDLGMQALGAAMHESRELVGRLRFLSGSHPHLVEAVNQLIHESHWSDRIEVSFHHDIPRSILSYTEFNTAFRIIQESLNNVARHSMSESARVEAIVAEDALRIRIEDEGIGFDPLSVDGDHFGIEGMRLRVALMEGRFDIDSRLGGGTHVRAEIPINGRAAAG
jgi:two-component system, NarL family, sensor histidine kinase DegS